MLPFVLVLLVASSALAAPSVNVNQYLINEVPPVRDNGKPISSYLTDRAFEIVDGGDTNIYALTIHEVMKDLADQPDRSSQTLAVGQTVAVLGELATGIPGDSCEAAALIDAYANYLQTGNSAGVRISLRNWIKRVSNGIDLIVQLANNPNSGRYTRGPSGNCAGGGRSYQFEAAWRAVLSGAGHSGLVYEEYCAAKRLYGAFNSRSNNVGAAVTAASIAPSTQVVQEALSSLTGFLRAIANGVNPAAQAAQAKVALARAVGNVQL